MPNERAISNGAGGAGNSATGRTDFDKTPVADFASLVTSRLGQLICQSGIKAGRIGNVVVEIGRDVRWARGASGRTMRLIAADKRCAEAIEEYCEIIQHLRDMRIYLQDEAKREHERDTP